MEARSLAAAFMAHDTTGEIAEMRKNAYLVLPNVRAKRATAAGCAGQQAQNGAKPQRLMAGVACRWRSA